MKNFEEMSRDELRREASARGIKNYITMSNTRLVEELQKDEERKVSIAAQLGQDAKSKVEQAIEFYDTLASYGACDLYAKVDAIVDDREMSRLDDEELDQILALRGEFDPNNFKKAKVEKVEKPVKEFKKSVTGTGISFDNPVLLEVKAKLDEGKNQSQIARELGRSGAYISKCVRTLKLKEERAE